MMVRAVIRDSLLYPFTSLGNFLVLGILFMLTTFGLIFESMGWGIFDFNLGIFGLMISLLLSGYLVRIISSSFGGSGVLPGFSNWKGLLGDGFKVLVVGVLYLVPFFVLGGGLFLGFVSGGGLLVWVWGVVFGLYGLVFSAFFLLSLCNMVFYDGKLEKALGFNDIFGRISGVGWGKFIKLYVIVFLVFLALIGLSATVVFVLGLFFPGFVSVLFVQLVTLPYLLVFIFRSVALFYSSTGVGYLVCEDCKGYYKLEFAEFSGDFSDKCECGGKLRFVKDLKEIEGSGDRSSDFKSVINKWNLVIFGLLALIIGALVIVSPQVVLTTNKTLIGTYEVNDDNHDYLIIDIPPEYENIELEYNLTRTGLKSETTGQISSFFAINGYIINNTDLPNYYKSHNLLHDNDNGSYNLNDKIKRLEIYHSGVKGTFKIYSVKETVEFKSRFN